MMMNMPGVDHAIELAKENSFGVLLAHAPYTLNPCSADFRVREFALLTMGDDLNRLEYLPNNYYNLHPGSHGGQGVDTGIKLITEALNETLTTKQTTKVLLETMAGKGTEVGRTFEELRRILDGVYLSDQVGVCLDTCHIHDAGYDIVNDLEGVLEEFDRILSLEKLWAIHINDSKNSLGSHKDRHEKIGLGTIGLEAITRVINHPVLKELPFYLETPNELPGYAEEISLLRGLFQEG
jgi:deoxyribonuclease-4